MTHGPRVLLCGPKRTHDERGRSVSLNGREDTHRTHTDGGRRPRGDHCDWAGGARQTDRREREALGWGIRRLSVRVRSVDALRLHGLRRHWRRGGTAEKRANLGPPQGLRASEDRAFAYMIEA